MNTLVKTAIAGALTLGASSAFAIGVVSSNNSDLILYVDAISGGSSTGVYALDTGISINSLMPQSGLVLGASNNTSAFSGTTKTFAPTAALSAFLSSHSSSTIEWMLEAGQFNGVAGTGTTNTSNNNNSVAQGAAIGIFTSPTLTAATGASTASTTALEAFLSGLNGDVSPAGGLAALVSSKETATGLESAGATSKFGFFGGVDLSNTGTGTSSAVKLFGFTGQGVNNGVLESYILGTATLAADGTLQINGNGSTPVPLPAAVWLFGSGLMGLVGVSRRRKNAAAAA